MLMFNFKFKKFRFVIAFCVMIGLFSVTCYAGIRVKSHGGEVLNPNLSYIVSETVVEDGMDIGHICKYHKTPVTTISKDEYFLNIVWISGAKRMTTIKSLMNQN